MRIASLSPAATEILFGLGLGLGVRKKYEIVCVDQFSNFPEEAKEIPHVKGMTDMPPDALREFRPDIVLLDTSIQRGLSMKLRDAGFAVVFHDPRTINAIYEMIRNLGAMLDCREATEALVLSMQRGFNDVKRKSALLPKKLKVYIEEWHEPPYVSGNWVPEVARIAGMEQFPMEAGSLSPEVTLEQVAVWDPDLIVISWCGAGNLAEKELLLKRPGWDQLRSVQTGAVKVIDDSLLNRPGPRLVDGARHLYGWAFEMLH